MGCEYRTSVHETTSKGSIGVMPLLTEFHDRDVRHKIILVTFFLHLDPSRSSRHGYHPNS